MLCYGQFRRQDKRMIEPVTEKKEKGVRGLLESLSELVGHLLREKRPNPYSDSSRIRAILRDKKERMTGKAASLQT